MLDTAVEDLQLNPVHMGWQEIAAQEIELANLKSHLRHKKSVVMDQQETPAPTLTLHLALRLALPLTLPLI